MKKIFRLFVAVFMLATSLFANAQTSPEIFGDGLGWGWGSWSWPPSPQPVSTATSPTFKGNVSIRMNFNAQWAGFSPGASVPFDTTGYKSLVFAVYNSSNAGQLYLRATTSSNLQTPNSLYLQDYTTNNVIPQGQWTWIRIPIADLQIGTNPQISYLSIQSANIGVAYFDEMRFEVNQSIFEANVAGQYGPSLQIWHWNSTILYPIGNYLDIIADGTWGGVQFNVVNKNTGTMPASHFDKLAVSFQKTVSGQSLFVQLAGDTSPPYGSVNLENYVPGGVAALGTWYRVLIPFSAFGVSTQNLTGVVFVSSTAGRFFIDDVKLINSSYLKNFRFPLEGDYQQGAYTPQKIHSVLDHRMTIPYTNLDGFILSFSGEQFQTNNGSFPIAKFGCYPKSGGVSWSTLLSSLYVGSSGCVGNLANQANNAINYEAHPGYDYFAYTGTVVKSVASGVVVSTARCIPLHFSTCNNMGAVGVDHGNGYVTQYLHLSAYSVNPGQVVKAGTILGLSGSTGTISPHLHFEVLKRLPGYAEWDYTPEHYVHVDPYGFNFATGYADVWANTNSVPNVCLWLTSCRYNN